MQQELFDPSPEYPPTRAGGHRPAAYRIPIYRVTLVRESTLKMDRQRLCSSQDVANLLRQYLDGVDREYVVAMLLDRKNRVIGINTVSMGSLSASVVHPRETYKPAILSNAAAIILGHNHPSGDPQPSQEDRALTQRLAEAGKLLGIEVIDHVIVGDGTRAYFSFADQQLL